MSNKIEKIYQKMESWFFWFWVKSRKFTFLVAFAILGIGLYAAFILPKESSPDIKFGIIQVTTVYPWVNPQDIDTLITQKIEQEIKDIDGIKKITSNSSIGVSSTTIELENDVDVSKIITDIKDGIDKVALPSDVEDPIVTEISTDSERIFDVLIYGPAEQFTPGYLKDLANTVKADIQSQGIVSSIDIQWSSEYEIRVIVNTQVATKAWIRISDISNAIRSNNNQPLWNHRIDALNYTFRIQGELLSEQSIAEILIPTNNGTISLWSIAEIQRHYKDERIAMMWTYQSSGYNFVTLTFNKNKEDTVFGASEKSKQALETILKKYQGIQRTYTQDIADVIQDDYQTLASNGLQTIILVFFAILLFVGLKESIIASITIPLAFLITFIVLNQLGLSLNFLTNFSLIICFGIAIDTTIVIIEGAHEKMRLWFNPKSAVLLAVEEYKRPLISWTATTCVVFLPMLSLPWVIGKFLAYIPITIFTTLIAALFISLTINSALYYKLSSKKNTYEEKPEEIDYLTDEEKALLIIEREGKKSKEEITLSRREKILDYISQTYAQRLGKIMENKKTRIISIIGPIALLIVSFIVISPQLWFTLFPSWDNPFIAIQVSAKEGTTTETMINYTPVIDQTLTKIQEIKAYYYTIKDNAIDINVELLKKTEREEQNLRNSFQVEEEINNKLKPLTSAWLRVATKVQAGWPPAGKAVGIKLIADSNEQFATLMNVAKDFENYLGTLTGSKNVTNSSSQSPGQFIFTIDKQKLALMGLLPNEISNELFIALNGIQAGTIKARYDNYDIKIMYDDFIDAVNPSDIANIRIPTRIGSVTLGTVADYTFESAINNISRQDTNITVTIDADVESGITPDVLQSAFREFAQQYKYPSWIRYQEWGETQENADLIQAMGVAFIIAIILIYTILVLQFNSFLQPAIIMYSIVMWLLWTNIGLWLTGNPYSMSFAIWFIALTGIVVNDAIVFIDRANNNLKRWLSTYNAIVETGKSRLQPIILTTLTTVVWLSSVARQDEFFAWLAYTIMFWLAMASAMTLLVIPALYHDQDRLIHIIKRSVITGIIYISIPLGVIASIYVIALMFGRNSINSSMSIISGIIMILYIIWYEAYTIYNYKNNQEHRLENIIGLYVVQQDGQTPTTKQALIRQGYKRGSILWPTIVLSIIHPALWFMGLLIVVSIHGIYARLDEENRTLYDKRANTKIITTKSS